MTIRNALRWVGALAALAVLPAGCVDAGGMVVVVQAQVPDLTMGCSIPATRTTERRDRGVLDVGLDRDYPYYLYPLVANRLPALAEPNDVEPNRVEITGAQVRIEAPPGVSVPWSAACPPEFDDPTQLSLLPGEEGSIIVQAMRNCHASLFRQLFVSGRLSSSLSDVVNFRVTVRAKGRHGSTGLLSEPFEFPIRVCYGCLQTGFTGAFAQFNFPATPLCDKLGDNPFRGNPCNTGQDMGPVLCCARDAEKKLFECPGNPAAPKP